MTGPLGRLNELPRAHLGHAPTPIERMANLESRFGNAALFIKRDDCTGLAFGGNKVRQLEFYLGEALSRRADTVLVTGAVQSNFVRLAAAASARLGMACHVQLEDRVPMADPLYRDSGNVLLDRILGATVHTYPDGEDEAGADRRVREIAAELEARGRRPYVIPLAPGHKPLGALGYVVAAAETLEQMAASERRFDEIVVPSGSGNTHAGLLFGLRALGCAVPVLGACVRRDARAQRPRIVSLCQEIAELLGVDNPVDAGDVRVSDDVLAPGYGRLNERTVRAMLLAARCEGLLLDPVYSAKAMAVLLQCAEQGGDDRTLLLVHTGGTPATFAYGALLAESLVAPEAAWGDAADTA